MSNPNRYVKKCEKCGGRHDVRVTCPHPPRPADPVELARRSLSTAEQQLLDSLKVYAMTQLQLALSREELRRGATMAIAPMAHDFRTAEAQVKNLIEKVANAHIVLVAKMAEARKEEEES